MANGRRLDVWDGAQLDPGMRTADLTDLSQVESAAYKREAERVAERGGRKEYATSAEEKAGGERAASTRENAMWALMALILPAVLPGGAAYGAAGGLAGGLRGAGQRAGGYKIPGSDAPGFVPPAGSVQAGVSSFQPGVGGRFWGSGRTPGASGSRPTVTQWQTMMNRTSDLGNTRLPGVPGPNRPQPPSRTGRIPPGKTPRDSVYAPPLPTGGPYASQGVAASRPQGPAALPSGQQLGLPPARTGGAGSNTVYQGQQMQQAQARVRAAEDAYLAQFGHPPNSPMRSEILFGHSGSPHYKATAREAVAPTQPMMPMQGNPNPYQPRTFAGRPGGAPVELSTQDLLAQLVRGIYQRGGG